MTTESALQEAGYLIPPEDKGTEPDEDLTAEIKQFARSRDANLVGITSVSRFEGVPGGHGPRDYVRNAQSVIVIGIKIPDPVVDCNTYAENMHSYPWWAESEATLEVRHYGVRHSIYLVMGHHMIDILLSTLAIKIADKLEDQGYRSIPFPNTNLSWMGGKSELKGWGDFAPFSHRHAAVRAGLGEFGYNNIVLTPAYGPRVRFNSIVTEATLVADPLVSKPICLREKCSARGPLCLLACTRQAITRREGIDNSLIFYNTPSKTDKRICTPRPKTEETQCRDYRACQRVCPIGSKRTKKS
ncbi:MAG: epoxyqueuosine reductase [Chloroflexi bacterium]|nr:epoxyqueuosine reductase [Chloroflexota bacterium]